MALSHDAVVLLEIGLGSGLLAFFSWLLKQSLTRALDRSLANSTADFKARLDRDLAAHKADLDAKNQRDLERLRAELSRSNEQDLERVRATLIHENDGLRHGLQVELIKVQSAHGKRHDIYPELYEKLRMLEGAVAGLRGVRFGASYEDFGESEFDQLFVANNLSSVLRNRLHATLRSDREKGIREIRRVLHDIEVDRAASTYSDANNFLILKTVYVKPAIVEYARTALQELWGAWVEVDMGRREPTASNLGAYRAHLQAAAAAITLVETEMRQDLASS